MIRNITERLSARLARWLRLPIDTELALEALETRLDACAHDIARMRPIVDAATTCLVDIGFTRDPTIIVIASKINGGYVKFISVKGPESFKEVQDLVADIEDRYGARTEILDAPRSVARIWQDERAARTRHLR